MKRNRNRKHALSFALVAALAAIVNAQTPPSGGYNIQLLALPGPVTESSFSQRMNESGHVLGYSYEEIPGPNITKVWYFDGQSTVQLGLTGPAVEPEGFYRGSGAELFNNLNHVAGASYVYNDAGYVGTHVWFFDGTTTRRIGVSPPIDNNKWACTPLYINQSGKVVGELQATNIPYPSIVEPWYFDGTTSYRIGLTGEGYGRSDLSFDFNYTSVFSESGGVIGVTRRMNTGSGQDGWVSNGITTQRIGLSGGVYEVENYQGQGIFRNSRPYSINNAGAVIGISNRGISYGVDSWIYNGSTTTSIGLTGADYDYPASWSSEIIRASIPYRLNEASQVTGYGYRYGPNGIQLGFDTWFYNGSTTTRVGLIGPEYETVTPSGVYRRSDPSLLTESGIMAGSSLRHPILPVDDLGFEPSNGRDAWIYDGTTTRQVGLTGSDYETVVFGMVVRTSYVSAINNAGQVVGISKRSGIQDTTNFPHNWDNWFFNGESTRYIGLTGSPFEYDDGTEIIRSGEVLALSESGKAVGYNQRYSPAGEWLGESPWFYDSNTDVVSPLIFSVRPSDQYSDASVSAMTESGVVFGNYLLFDGEIEIGYRPYWWSVDTGMIDLGDLVAGGLDAAGWDQLFGVRYSFPYDPSFGDAGTFGVLPDGAPMYILGSGRLEGQTDIRNAFLMSANIPEPTTLAMLGGIVVCVMRRRRSY